jgi:hypothetical protein
MKLMVKIAGGILLAFVLLAAGCAALVSKAADEATKEKAWSVRVTAPAGKCWSGAVGAVSKDGCGSQTVTFSDMAITAVVLQKRSAGSWTLNVSLVSDGTAVDTKEASAEYGVVTVDGTNF